MHACIHAYIQVDFFLYFFLIGQLVEMKLSGVHVCVLSKVVYFQYMFAAHMHLQCIKP